MTQIVPPATTPRGAVRLALIDADTTLRQDGELRPEGRDLLAALDEAMIPLALCSSGPADDLLPLADNFQRLTYLVVDGGDSVLRRGTPEWRDLDDTVARGLDPVGPDAIAPSPDDLDDEDDEPGPDAPVCRGGSRIVESLGIRWRNVLAIGDNDADLAMLSLAGVAVCIAPLNGADLAPAMRRQVRVSCAHVCEALDALRAMEPSPLP